MPLTLAEAAQATGLNRSTILRAIKGGRITGTRDESGAWVVEPVELHRVFPAASARVSGMGRRDASQIERIMGALRLASR